MRGDVRGVPARGVRERSKRDSRAWGRGVALDGGGLGCGSAGAGGGACESLAGGVRGDGGRVAADRLADACAVEEEEDDVVGAALVLVSVLVVVLVLVVAPVLVLPVAEAVPVFVSPQAMARVKQAISGRSPRRCMAHDIAGRGAMGRELCDDRASHRGASRLRRAGALRGPRTRPRPRGGPGCGGDIGGGRGLLGGC